MLFAETYLLFFFDLNFFFCNFIAPKLCGVLTFPLGFAIGRIISNNIEQNKMELEVTDAVVVVSLKAASIISEYKKK